MFELFQKLVFAGQLRMERGKISMLKQPVALIPIEMFSYVLKNTKTKKDVGRYIYEGCKLSAKTFAKNIRKTYKFKGIDLTKWLVELFLLSGWGELTLQKIDMKNKMAIFYLKDSPVCKLYGKSNAPIDFAIAGLLAGGGCEIFRENINCKEVKCKAMGSPFCIFTLSKAKK